MGKTGGSMVQWKFNTPILESKIPGSWGHGINTFDIS